MIGLKVGIFTNYWLLFPVELKKYGVAEKCKVEVQVA